MASYAPKRLRAELTVPVGLATSLSHDICLQSWPRPVTEIKLILILILCAVPIVKHTVSPEFGPEIEFRQIDPESEIQRLVKFEKFAWILFII